ncbi:MAG: RNA methyltransferase [Bacteroidetes bacterium B1(2017)]|nr:MAG: RNA methyltransferase [Bacteroidetes bacterium B1(2017)]
MNTLPVAFKNTILSLFPEEAGYFFDALSNPVITSVRLNPDKPSSAFSEAEHVEWCPLGRYLPQRPSFIEDPLLHAGAYYVQESSSLFLQAVVSQLGLNQNSVALDLCAAPGGKSTLLLGALPSQSLLVSNEIIKSRVSVLQENLIRWGAPNVLITNNDPKQFQKAGALFDLILIDAPCSGEGLWRRDPKAMDEWSEEHVELCALRQERILHDILPCLKAGGILIYSTCTFNEQENELQLQKFLVQTNLIPYPIEVNPTWKIKNTDGWQFKFLPHLVKGEGLFMAIMQKPHEQDNSNKHQRKAPLNFVSKKLLPQIHSWLKNPTEFDYFTENDFVYAFPLAHIQTYESIRATMYVKHAGICMGKLDKAGKLIPEHSLALSTALNPSISKVELSKEEALTYLKRGNLTLSANTQEGWCLAVYEGLALGWMKILPNRINNYFPAEYRIQKDIQ